MLSIMLMISLIQPVSSDFTAMSFNIRYDNPDDGASAWPHRAESVAAEMSTVELIGVQEALSHQVQELALLLPGYAWVGVGRDDGENGGEFSPIFFREVAFELLETTTFWLSETPNQSGSQGWDAALPRIVTSAHLKFREIGTDFLVINTHFDHLGTQARYESAKLLSEYVNEFSGPTILLGDLNSTPDSQPIAMLIEKGAMQDAFTVSMRPNQGPVGTFSGFLERNDLGEAPRIDYILPSHHWRVISYEAIISIQNGRYVSDHLPIKAQLQLIE